MTEAEEDSIRLAGAKAAEKVMAQNRSKMQGFFGVTKAGENRSKPMTAYQIYMQSLAENPETKGLSQRVKDEMWAQEKLNTAVQGGLDLRK